MLHPWLVGLWSNSHPRQFTTYLLQWTILHGRQITITAAQVKKAQSTQEGHSPLLRCLGGEPAKTTTNASVCTQCLPAKVSVTNFNKIPGPCRLVVFSSYLCSIDRLETDAWCKLPKLQAMLLLQQTRGALSDPWLGGEGTCHFKTIRNNSWKQKEHRGNTFSMNDKAGQGFFFSQSS